MKLTEEEKAFIWLCSCTDTDYRTRVLLLQAAKNPANLWRNPEKFFREVINGRENRVYNIDRVSRERDLNAVLLAAEERGYFFVSLLSDDYPTELKEISAPPLLLFGAGNRELLGREKFCIVGSRLTPPWAEKQARAVSEALSERFVIVTGLAEGGDSAAIAGALESGNLICVLPNGLNVCYPAGQLSVKERVRKKGLLLSEYPFDEPLKRFYFHARNRILAGLAKGTLVVSAGERSGALITANYTADYGRDLYAFPYNLGVSQGAGCNAFIKKGAYLATGANDIFSGFGIRPREKKQEDVTEEEARVLALLREEGELHVAVIAERTGIAIYAVTAVLSALEMKNLAAKAGGNRYCAI